MRKGERFTHETQRETESGINVSEQSRASASHANRNEDAALGDKARLHADLAVPPQLLKEGSDLLTKRPELAKLEQLHLKTIKESAQRELGAADALAKREIRGLFDGVSGKESGLGAGAVASRLASSVMSERLAAMPEDADVQTAMDAIKEAMNAANDEVMAYKSNADFSKDLEQMGCTADVLKIIDNGDDSYDVAYGHIGDGRIYVLDGETGELRQQTRDNTVLEALVDMRIEKGENHGLTPEEAKIIAEAQIDNKDAMHAALPRLTKPQAEQFFALRQAVVNSFGQDGNKAEIGSFKVRKGDKVLMTSDGVHDNVSDEELQAMLTEGKTAEDIADRAFEKAGGPTRNKAPDAKGPDDITLKFIEFGEATPDRDTSVYELSASDLVEIPMLDDEALVTQEIADIAKIHAEIMELQDDEPRAPAVPPPHPEAKPQKKGWQFWKR